MSDLDDITKRMKPNKVHGVPEPTVTQEDVYKGIYNASDYAALPGQTLSKGGANLWESLTGNPYGNEAAGTLAGLAPFLFFKNYPLGVIGGYVAPNVFNSTLHEPAIEAKLAGKNVSNIDVATNLGNAIADLHPAMFVPKMAADVLKNPVASNWHDAGLLLANLPRFNIFNPYNLAANYGEDEKITKYVDDKYDDYKRSLKYAWENDKKSLPFVASAGLLDYAIRSLFSNRLQNF